MNSVSVSADGLYVASGGVDGCVCKWDTKTWTREELVVRMKTCVGVD